MVTLYPWQVALLARPDLQPAAHLFAMACNASRMHDRQAKRAFANYGDRGPQISGCVRDHFPESVKDELRALARMTSARSDAAYAARPPRVRFKTMVNLARTIAQRDGAGFYGPQPLF